MVGVAARSTEPFNVCRKRIDRDADVLDVARVSWRYVANPNLCGAVSVTASGAQVVDSNRIDFSRGTVAADGHRVRGRRSWANVHRRCGGTCGPLVGQVASQPCGICSDGRTVGITDRATNQWYARAVNWRWWWRL